MFGEHAELVRRTFAHPVATPALIKNGQLIKNGFVVALARTSLVQHFVQVNSLPAQPAAGNVVRSVDKRQILRFDRNENPSDLK